MIYESHLEPRVITLIRPSPSIKHLFTSSILSTPCVILHLSLLEARFRAKWEIKAARSLRAVIKERAKALRFISHELIKSEGGQNGEWNENFWSRHSSDPGRVSFGTSDHGCDL